MPGFDGSARFVAPSSLRVLRRIFLPDDKGAGPKPDFCVVGGRHTVSPLTHHARTPGLSALLQVGPSLRLETSLRP
jgi:hypothetical protein